MDCLKLSIKRIADYFRNPYIPESRECWIFLSIEIAATGIGLLILYWDSLNGGESASTTIRNVGLILAALVAFPIALWRGIVADNQSVAAQSQANAAQQSLRNERYQRGAEMLGNEVLAVRLGGIYALQRLAQEYPEEYHVQIMRLFCAFARNPTEDEEYDAKLDAEAVRFPRTREDVQEVLRAISKRNWSDVELESIEKFYLDLRGANLQEILISGGNLYGAYFWGANLSGAGIEHVDLSYVTFLKADLSRVTFSDVDLFKSEFDESDLTDAELHEVRTFTQSQVDKARAEPDNPPKFYESLDPETGKPLVWTGGQGAPLKD